MSTPNGVMSFAQSQRYRMHFKNQHAFTVRRKSNVLEIKAFAVLGEGLTHRAERRESHWPDTDSRLLTEVNPTSWKSMASLR
jgi:hypothetical protein